jgi:proteasome lid subunit RPN8/RPN11
MARQTHATYVVAGESFDRAVARARKLAKKDTEICGLIVRCGDVLHLVETRNVTERPFSFVIHRGDWKAIEGAAEVLGFSIAGTFHSHVLSPAIPGCGDLAGAYSGHLMLIISTDDMKGRLWEIRRGKAVRRRLRFRRP